jgi:hypothetical protein
MVAAVPEAERTKVFAQIIAADPASAAAFAEAWWERWPASAPAVALASHVGRRLAPADALVWSMRLRATGFGEHCPLVARARRADLAAENRILAAATAFTGFGDERALALVAGAAPALDEDQVAPVLEQLQALAPALVEPYLGALGAAAR